MSARIDYLSYGLDKKADQLSNDNMEKKFEDLSARIDYLSYGLDKKANQSSNDNMEKKFEDLSAKLDNLSSSLATKANQSAFDKILELEFQLAELEDKVDVHSHSIEKDLKKKLDTKADKSALEKIEEKVEKICDFFTWDWYDLDDDFIMIFSVILSLILFVASNGLLIYLQVIGMPILNLWLDALILLGISAFPIVVWIIFLDGPPIYFIDFFKILFATFLILLIAAILMVVINFAAFDILYYFVH